MELHQLLVDLYFENKISGPQENRAFDQLLIKIKKAPETYWSLDLMTDFCNLSVSQLNRMFKRKTGMTSKNYIDNIKMQLASEKLTSPSKTVKEISSELGYDDPYHFSRRFKELKGYSPQEYRKLFLR
jgi:AraC-like DNA-binding protein